ncbi:hypothetical protein BS47DRAFT_1397428 [Hydnum rufescens UP504]|uniref:Uncharacterized protein n=1 Tax=Hydnum rufescens UP504 TaxID=1448309 RepID=A0A9P6ANQ0_9AGAM|nr:hypothetical protein BS47DRAFT_1397428 [Hydnum rufescens UP504]
MSFHEPTSLTSSLRHDRKPSPEPPPYAFHHPTLNLDMPELTLVECVRTHLRDSTLTSPFHDQTHGTSVPTVLNPLSSRVDTSRGVVTPPKSHRALNLTCTNETESRAEAAFSPGSTASSLMNTTWKPGHSTQQHYLSLRLNEPKAPFKYSLSTSDHSLSSSDNCLMPASWGTPKDPQQDNMVIMSTPIEEAQPSTNESLINMESVDQEVLHHRALLVAVADSICCEQGPNAAVDVRLINTSLYHLAYKLDMESPRSPTPSYM